MKSHALVAQILYPHACCQNFLTYFVKNQNLPCHRAGAHIQFGVCLVKCAASRRATAAARPCRRLGRWWYIRVEIEQGNKRLQLCTSQCSWLRSCCHGSKSFTLNQQSLAQSQERRRRMHWRAHQSAGSSALTRVTNKLRRTYKQVEKAHSGITYIPGWKFIVISTVSLDRLLYYRHSLRLHRGCSAYRGVL